MYSLESKPLVIHLLDAYSALNKDWDGYGAEPIDPKIINRAKQMLDGLAVMPDVYPTSNSTIQFEFEHGEAYLEVEIEKDCLRILICHNNDYENMKTMVIPDGTKFHGISFPDSFIVNGLIMSEIVSLPELPELPSNKLPESSEDLRELFESLCDPKKKKKDGN